jgi:hypothetical protein
MLGSFFSKGRGRIRTQIGPSVFLSKDTHETMQNETANPFMTNSAHLRSHSMIVREKTTLYFYPNISFYVTSKSATFSTVLMNLIFKSKNLLIYALLR